MALPKQLKVKEFVDAKDKVVRNTKKTVKLVDREAHRKPWQFMGIAALFSAFFGFLLGRKASK